MSKTMTIGKWGATCLVLVTMCTQIFLNLPRTVTEAAGTASWILLLYTGAIAFMLFTFIQRLFKRFEGKDLIDIAEIAAGKPGRIIICIIYVIHFLFIISIVFRQFSEDLKIIALVDSPITFVGFFLLAGMTIGAYFGLETLARLGTIIVPIIILSTFIIISGVTQFHEMSRIMPILGNGFQAVFVKGIPKISIFSGILILFLINPAIKTSRNLRIVGYTGLLITIFLMAANTLTYLFVYAYPTATEFFLPAYMLARIINYGRFFQRIESIFVLAWVSAALIYLSVTFYLTVEVFRKGFGIKNYRPLIPAFTIIVFTLSLLPKNLVSAIKLETDIFRNFAGIIAYGLTIVILILAHIAYKRKESSKNDAKA